MIVHTLIPDQLEKYISMIIEKGEKVYVNRKIITMKVLPEFANLFHNSQTMSSNVEYLSKIFRRV